MEDDPFALIEAMTIAGFATGAEKGFLYVRGEYPLAAERLARAVAAARARSLLGGDVMGRGVRFDVEIRRGAGAYICGEETALFNSIEGFRGEPRNKPPFPVEVGLFGKPTCVNNVETLVSALDVLALGAAAYAAIGTAGSAGTKLFCVSGHVERPGVYEVPFGTRLDALIALAGGVRGGASLQTVLLGGAAGTFVRPDELATPLTFEDARRIGATLGSGVVLVLDDTTESLAHARAHRRVLPRRVLRPVRALPRRHRPAGGAGHPPRAAAARSAPSRPSAACSASWARRCATPPSAASARRRRAPSSRRSRSSACCAEGAMRIAARRCPPRARRAHHRRRAGARPRGRDDPRRLQGARASRRPRSASPRTSRR